MAAMVQAEQEAMAAAAEAKAKKEAEEADARRRADQAARARREAVGRHAFSDRVLNADLMQNQMEPPAQAGVFEDDPFNFDDEPPEPHQARRQDWDHEGEDAPPPNEQNLRGLGMARDEHGEVTTFGVWPMQLNLVQGPVVPVHRLPLAYGHPARRGEFSTSADDLRGESATAPAGQASFPREVIENVDDEAGKRIRADWHCRCGEMFDLYDMEDAPLKDIKVTCLCCARGIFKGFVRGCPRRFGPGCTPSIFECDYAEIVCQSCECGFRLHEEERSFDPDDRIKLDMISMATGVASYNKNETRCLPPPIVGLMASALETNEWSHLLHQIVLGYYSRYCMDVVDACMKGYKDPKRDDPGRQEDLEIARDDVRQVISRTRSEIELNDEWRHHAGHLLPLLRMGEKFRLTSQPLTGLLRKMIKFPRTEEKSWQGMKEQALEVIDNRTLAPMTLTMNYMEQLRIYAHKKRLGHGEMMLTEDFAAATSEARGVVGPPAPRGGDILEQ